MIPVLRFVAIRCDESSPHVVRRRIPVTAGTGKTIFLVLSLLLFCRDGLALGQPRYIENAPRPGSFAIANKKNLATICVDASDYPGVIRAATDLQADVARVTGIAPKIAHDAKSCGNRVILIGAIGHSELIDRFIQEHHVDIAPIAGKWESFLIQVVPEPAPGVSSALLITGSDKRGAIYGIYDLSEQIGVSPWYWWADVPVQRHDSLFVAPGRYVQGPPAVKYRGIFLNDEAPSLTGWVNEKYGGYNHLFYVKVFELLLRLKANYLWPAMWDSAFNADDLLNPKLADEYGIVMGTSHQEPMMRAWKEWDKAGKGAWDYLTNAETLRDFWKEGIERNNHYEGVITMGMRGNGDLPMSQSANIDLLEKIVADQRKIIADVMHTDPATVQQDWALYKEVQEYYEKGMRVPDDITLLWSDDNWGDIRRLPTPDERKRAGSAGVYYHFDYVGDPRSYKWLNTVPITKVWEQMDLAHEYDANRIWIVNVGDLKPMEFPIEFFLNLAWNPQRWPKEKIQEYGDLWAAREFGPTYAPAIAEILSKYTKYNGDRKPELLDPDTFSLVNYGEADEMFAKWKSATEKAEDIYRRLPENERDAFFQLVLYPTKASAQVAELYITVGKNRLCASQGRASANDLAAQARALFQADSDLSNYYNHALAHGKWDHMMDQTHIGYASWNQPPANVMPKVTEITLPATSQMGVAVEGSTSAWPGSSEKPILPALDCFNRQRRYIDVFNRGSIPFSFSATTRDPAIIVSQNHGTLDKEQRVWVSVDWSKAAKGSSTGYVKISGAGAPDVTVQVDLFNPATPTRDSLEGFAESEGYVSIEAEHYTKNVSAGAGQWERIADYGRTLSSMTVFPVTAESVVPPLNSPHLEYKMYLFDPGKALVQAILAPTLNFVPGRGLRFAISFDDQPPQLIDALAKNSQDDWAMSVKDSVRKVDSAFTLAGTGYHTLKFWMVDPGVVLQKLVVNLGGVRPSYFGPPESYRTASSIHRPSK